MFGWFKKCEHETDYENLDEYTCSKCKKKLSGVMYSPGGIGVTDDFFSWQIKRNYDSLASLVNWDERLATVKKRLKDEENIDVEFERTPDGKIRIIRKQTL